MFFASYFRRFSRLFKIVNFTDNAAATLNDTNARYVDNGIA